jgi:hypothetical protein
MILYFLLELFVILFNKTTCINKKIYFEVGNNYQLELNVSSINVAQKTYDKPNGDCALIPKNRLPKREVR